MTLPYSVSELLSKNTKYFSFSESPFVLWLIYLANFCSNFFSQTPFRIGLHFIHKMAQILNFISSVSHKQQFDENIVSSQAFCYGTLSYTYSWTSMKYVGAFRKWHFEVPHRWSISCLSFFVCVFRILYIYFTLGTYSKCLQTPLFVVVFEDITKKCLL